MRIVNLARYRRITRLIVEKPRRRFSRSQRAARELIRAARRNLGKRCLRQSGAVLFSSRETLRPGRFYLLGLNPGGVPNRETIGDSLTALHRYTKNAYLDEVWAGCPKGEAPIQVRVRTLAAWLGLGTRKLCASNLVFRRTRGDSGLDWPRDADSCWPVHELVLGQVNPDVILAFGNGNVSPYGYLRRLHRTRYDSWPDEDEFIPEGCESKRCKSFNTTLHGRLRLVLGFPHFRRFSLEGREDVAAWVKGHVSRRSPDDTARDS